MRKLIKGQKYVCVRSEQTELVRQKLYECESCTESGYVRMVGERGLFSESRFEPFLHEDTPPEQESVIMVVPGYGYGNISLDAVRKVVSKLEGKKGKFVRGKGGDYTSTHWVFEEDKVTNNIFHVGDLIDDGSTGKGVIYGKTKDEIYVRFFNGEDHKFDTNAETTFTHRRD